MAFAARQKKAPPGQGRDGNTLVPWLRCYCFFWEKMCANKAVCLSPGVETMGEKKRAHPHMQERTQ